jgi:SAM-dependent methyltransferase
VSAADDEEFDTEASWVAAALAGLPPGRRIAGACRGSGQPAALAWLSDPLQPGVATRFLDLGGGIGGPAAWLEQRSGCRPVVADPAVAGPRNAARLFELPGVACATTLPFADRSFDAAWTLATLSTVDDPWATLAELHRVLRPGAVLGIQEYVRRAEQVERPPEGNRFLSEGELTAALDTSGFEVVARAEAAELPEPDQAWREDERRVEEEVAARHEGEEALEDSRAAQRRFGELLDAGVLSVGLFRARRRE